MNRKVEVDLDELLDLVLAINSCGQGMAFDALAEWSGGITEEEINSFLTRYNEDKEDIDIKKQDILDWYNLYKGKYGYE